MPPAPLYHVCSIGETCVYVPPASPYPEAMVVVWGCVIVVRCLSFVVGGCFSVRTLHKRGGTSAMLRTATSGYSNQLSLPGSTNCADL